jgi:PUA domain protein
MAAITIRKRHAIRRSDVADLEQRLQHEIGEDARLFKSDRVEVAETDSTFQLYLIDKKLLIFGFDGLVFPTVRGAIERPFPGRRVLVDQGAIPYVIKGADVMRPGIVSVTDDVRAGSPVVIAEQRYNKPLAIGVALLDAPAMREATKGKMCKNIHHVGDDLWNLELR